MLKFKLSAEEIKALPEILQKEYKAIEGEDGMFLLDAPGESNEAIANLKASVNSERKLRETADKQLKDVARNDEAFTQMKSDYEELKSSKGDEAWKLQEKNLKAEIVKRDGQINDLTGKVDTMTSAHRKDLLHQTMTSIVPDTVRKGAMKDILLRAERDLEYSDDLNGGKGGFMDAESGLEVKDWFSGQLKESEHWLQPSSSSNPQGSTGGSGGAKTIKRDEFYSKPPSEKRELMAEGYQLTD